MLDAVVGQVGLVAAGEGVAFLGGLAVDGNAVVTDPADERPVAAQSVAGVGEVGVVAFGERARPDSFVAGCWLADHEAHLDVHLAFHVDDVIAQEVGSLVGELVRVDPLAQLFEELVHDGEHALERGSHADADGVPLGPVGDGGFGDHAGCLSSPRPDEDLPPFDSSCLAER